MFSGLLSVVERHLGEQVVADVGVGDVVHGVVKHRSERAIDSAKSTTEPVPLLVAEMWDERVGVLQVRDQHQVVVDDQEWQEVVHGHLVDAKGVDRSEEHTSELQSLMRISYAVFCLN